MFIEGGSRQQPVTVHCTSTGHFVGRIATLDGVEVFGPYPFDELIAVMNDWLRVAIRDARRELRTLHALHRDDRS